MQIISPTAPYDVSSLGALLAEAVQAQTAKPFKDGTELFFLLAPARRAQKEGCVSGAHAGSSLSFRPKKRYISPRHTPLSLP